MFDGGDQGSAYCIGEQIERIEGGAEDHSRGAYILEPEDLEEPEVLRELERECDRERARCCDEVMRVRDGADAKVHPDDGEHVAQKWAHEAIAEWRS